MKKEINILILASLCLGFCHRLSAQHKEIKHSFQRTSFSYIAQVLEEEYDLKVYYHSEWFDSLAFSTTSNPLSVPEFFDQLFVGSDFHYVRLKGDFDNHIIITKGVKIKDQVAVGFFDQVETNESSEVKSDIDNYLRERAQENITRKRINALENRVFRFGKKKTPVPAGRVVLSGKVKDISTGQPIVGALVYVEKPTRKGVATDAYGQYSLALPYGNHKAYYQAVGMKKTTRKIELFERAKLDVEMVEDVLSLDEVLIESSKESHVQGLEMGVQRLEAKSIKTLPTLLGEVDMVKVALTLPGVQSVGEGSSGFNVRGGGVDQNLLLLDNAPIYNSAHVFGFFSAFNPDVIESVELYKSHIPARFGGRISSVMDVQTRDGNRKKLSGSGGIGMLTGRLTLEGPFKKDKSSFLIGVRSTYSDWLLKQIENSTVQNSEGKFLDVNMKIVHEFNEKNAIAITGYSSNDRFKLNSDTIFSYLNRSVTIEWRRSFSDDLFGVFNSTLSVYKYTVSNENVPENAFTLNFELFQPAMNFDFNYSGINGHEIDFGLQSTLHHLTPGDRLALGNNSTVTPLLLEKERGLSTALYVSDQFDITDDLSLEVGIRYSTYLFLGPKTVSRYTIDQPKEPESISAVDSFASGELIKSYGGPEIRISSRYRLGYNSSIKASFNSSRQYIHLLTNTTAISPTDTWKLSDSHIHPQRGSQFSLGYFHEIREKSIEASLEVYHKRIADVLDYKNGAQLLSNPQIETDLINAEGRSYGLELFIKKKSSKLNGWLSYTWSRSQVKIDGEFEQEKVNDGNFFAANFDRTHSLYVVSNYKFTRRVSASATFNYSTGRPVTIPFTRFQFGGSDRVQYSDRNEFRIPDNIRVDVSFNLEGNHKIKKLAHSFWSFSVYNLFGRNNPYSVFFRSEEGLIKGYKLSVFGNAIPTLTYNFKF